MTLWWTRQRYFSGRWSAPTWVLAQRFRASGGCLSLVIRFDTLVTMRAQNQSLRASGSAPDGANESPWRDVRVSPAKTLRWLILHGLALGSFLVLWPIHWTGPLWFAGMTVLVSCVGVSVGMHRGVIHRSFVMPGWFRQLVFYLCSLTGMGGPTAFITMHQDRDYHQDQPRCPHFFGYQVGPLTSYAMLVFCVYTGPNPAPPNREALAECGWFARLLDQTYLLAPAPVFALLASAGGWTALWWGGLLPWVAGQNLFWLSNYICHTRGYVSFARPGHAEHGYNQRWLGFLSFGEGFHNNHHQYPWSARMGLAPDEVDLGWYLIRGLHAVGIVSEVRAARPDP
jgi:stearoyl-CoA desaturase (delta-9 desaturase)